MAVLIFSPPFSNEIGATSLSETLKRAGSNGTERKSEEDVSRRMAPTLPDPTAICVLLLALGTKHKRPPPPLSWNNLISSNVWIYILYIIYVRALHRDLIVDSYKLVGTKRRVPRLRQHSILPSLPCACPTFFKPFSITSPVSSLP